MSKSIDDEFRDYWRDEGRKEDNAYCGPVVAAEKVFKAGGEVMIKRMRAATSLDDGHAERSTNT